MAINNPYIPGDPFSYDLKWIVEKLKEYKLTLEGLATAIEDVSSDLQEFEDYVNNINLESYVTKQITKLYKSGLLDSQEYSSNSVSLDGSTDNYYRVPQINICQDKIIVTADWRESLPDLSPINIKMFVFPAANIDETPKTYYPFGDTRALDGRITDSATLVSGDRIFIFAHLINSTTEWTTTNPLDDKIIMTYTDDMGETFSSPVVVDVKNGYEAICTGCSKGIVLTSGRLVLPVYVRVDPTDYRATVIYSDDNGETWTMGNLIPEYTTEATIIEYDENAILLNARTSNYRAVYYTNQNSLAWNAHPSNRTALIDAGCQGALETIRKGEKLYKIFSHPAQTRRRNVSLFCSENNTDWTPGTLISTYNVTVNGYSNLVYDEMFGCFIAYETDRGVVVSNITGLVTALLSEFSSKSLTVPGVNPSNIAPDMDASKLVVPGYYRYAASSGVSNLPDSEISDSFGLLEESYGETGDLLSQKVISTQGEEFTRTNIQTLWYRTKKAVRTIRGSGTDRIVTSVINNNGMYHLRYVGNLTAFLFLYGTSTVSDITWTFTDVSDGTVVTRNSTWTLPTPGMGVIDISFDKTNGAAGYMIVGGKMYTVISSYTPSVLQYIRLSTNTNMTGKLTIELD